MLEADSARQSVQIFHQHQRTIDLVVIDLGLEDGRDELAGTFGVLHKPVRSDRLVALIGRALGRNMNLRRQTDQ